MIKINNLEDLKKVKDVHVSKYVKKLLLHLFREYDVNNIDSFGSIFLLESKEDLEHHLEFYLSEPAKRSQFEFIDDIGKGYKIGCVVITNDMAIDIVAKNEIFEAMEE